MSNNFFNLFNQVSSLITRFPQNPNVRGGNTPLINNNPSPIFTGINTQSPLPVYDFSINNTPTQQEVALNQELQETITQTQEALKEFTQEDKSALVKAMLDLPEDMSALLKNISNNNKNLTNAEFMKLLSSMNTQGKEALTKLSKLLVVFGANNLKGTEKLQEIYTIINACTSGNVQNASQLMKNMILLYLPWLPIGENNNFELGLKSNGDDDELSGDGGGTSDSVVILVQTVNYSNVSVTLSQVQNSSDIDMFVECAKEFPKEQLQNMISSSSKSNNVNANIGFSETKANNETKNDKMSYNVNVSKFLNPYLMVMSHAVIKAIIEIDKHSSLIDKRKAI